MFNYQANITSCTFATPNINPFFVSVIENFFNSYMHIGLQELEDVSLMDRSEEKYIIPIAWCGDISNKLCTDYNILEIANERQFRYDNLYFDTPENICLEDHIRGRKNRFRCA